MRGISAQVEDGLKERLERLERLAQVGAEGGLAAFLGVA